MYSTAAHPAARQVLESTRKDSVFWSKITWQIFKLHYDSSHILVILIYSGVDLYVNIIERKECIVHMR